MGSSLFHARTMTDRTDSDFASDTDSNDRDRDIATILRFLIRSGQVRIIAAASPQLYNDGSDDEYYTSPRAPPKIDNHPDTSCLKGSDIRQTILLNSGALNDRESSTMGMNSVPSMLKLRETGMNGRQQFSRGDQCQIYQRVLPNKMNVLDRYEGKVFCGTFARQGDIFISAAQDYIIRLYDTSKGLFNLKRTVEARDVGWSILDTAVSPDGCNFIYCSWSECIHMCTISGDQDIHEALPLYPDERRFCVFSLRFSQDGKEILGGANDQYLYVYNREANKRTLRIYSHEDDVNTVAFADNTSQILFSGGDDGICKVWDRRTLCESHPKPVGVLAGHEDGLTYVDSKGDGRHLITNSKDQTIKLWDMRAFSPSSSVEGAYKAVKSHNWDYRWQRVPTSFYDILTGKIKAILRGHKGCVRDVAWHPYRNEIMSSSWDGTVVKWTFNKTEIDSDSEDIMPGQSRSSEVDGLRRSQRLADQRRRQERETRLFSPTVL
nr:DDB1- and CUL4-associated factor 11 isoform X2 [Parasteatoda tepidariorum]